MRDERMTERKSLLDDAAQAVLFQRNKTYGEPDEDFQRIAKTLNALGYSGPDGRALLGHDVSVIMVALKLSRLTWSPTHRDSWLDIAGYAACGSETALMEEGRTKKEERDRAASVSGPPADMFSAMGNGVVRCGIECEAGHTYVGLCSLRIARNGSS